MKVLCSLIVVLMMITPATRKASGVTPHTGDNTTAAQTFYAKSAPRAFSAERSAPADANVFVSLCVASGNVVVRGWERNEVRARASDATEIELRQGSSGANSNNGIGNSNNGGGKQSPSTQNPAARLDVIVIDSINARRAQRNECRAYSDVELDVPRGATLELRTSSGDIRIDDVREARTQTMSGKVSARRISGGIEVSSMSGDVFVEDCAGALRLRSVSGSVEAKNARPARTGELLEASSTSGDIRLDHVAHARVVAATVSGDVEFSSALAQSGSYNLKTFSGDLNITLPSDASFQFNARVSRSGDLITSGLPFKFNLDSERSAARSFSGVLGSGDAKLTLSSFSGTIHLRRQ